ncbi:hypothetical protein JK358_05800 [Nocardia sp. 2]|uniref:Secreted protein n=1 Tax=Nocardia acididurans TaxID=2802282 RepID=A0ABS1LZQ4_9NOCA|nr:hypothetical protein [Nocardia acididurans]MBL1073902.1 hypothetical protein [Nocardia acididurans]
MRRLVLTAAVVLSIGFIAAPASAAPLDPRPGTSPAAAGLQDIGTGSSTVDNLLCYLTGQHAGSSAKYVPCDLGFGSSQSGDIGATPQPVGTLVPETGSSGALNGIVCALQSISAALPCLNT